MATARPLAGSAVDAGAGQLNLKGALTTARKLVRVSAKGRDDGTTQNHALAGGLGSLEAARGGGHLIDPDTGAMLRGEFDVQNQPWNPRVWRPASVEAKAWSGGRWNGARWTGEAWAGATWINTGWDGARWTGARWTDLVWSGARWTGARWTGARWTGARWTDQDWQ
jgi:serine protease AprX